MKFSAKKYIKDRDKSTERSRKGELFDSGLLRKTNLDLSSVDVIIARRSPLYEKAEACCNKLAVGCRLPRTKRNMPECEVCI